MPLTDRRNVDGLTLDVEQLPDAIADKKDEPLLFPIEDGDIVVEDEDDVWRRLCVYVHKRLHSR